MVKQYPHTISITWDSAPVKDETTGVYSKAGNETTFTSVCRAEANSTNRRVPLTDGTLVEFSFLVYMPKTSVVIPDNADYVLSTGETGKIKRARNNQLNSRIWL